MRATPRRSASRWPSSPLFSTGSDATNRRPPSPASRSVPSSAAAVPEITTAITHLREVLGEATYESLARKGETMTTAAMATYAYDQIDQARTELEHPELNCASRVSNARAAQPVRAESRGRQTSPVASKIHDVSAVARSSNQVGGAWAVMLPMSQ